MTVSALIVYLTSELRRAGVSEPTNVTITDVDIEWLPPEEVAPWSRKSWEITVTYIQGSGTEVQARRLVLADENTPNSFTPVFQPVKELVLNALNRKA